MATVNNSLPHIERTNAEPREHRIEPVVLSRIDQVNDTIRLLRLSPIDHSHTIKFLPGQWLDTFIPNLRQAGGFTLTSTPTEAKPSETGPGYLELAIQKSSNPPAQWLWKPESEILNAQLAVRVGGSFTWPPPKLRVGKIDRLVLVAGGVGVNPLVSIATQVLRHTPPEQRPKEVHILYTTRLPPSHSTSQVLFHDRLQTLVANAAKAATGDEAVPNVSLKLFFTNAREGDFPPTESPVRTVARRIEQQDLLEALDGSGGGGAEARQGTVAYVCGPPRMTDEFVDFMGRQEGMTRERVLCEKWW